MSDSYSVKKITELTENSAVADTDLLVVGNAGTAVMRKLTYARVKEETQTRINAVKALVLTTSSFSSLPQTVSDAAITADHVVLNSVLSNPAAQTGDWTVTTSAGSLTVAGTISGTTTLTLYLVPKQ